MQQFLISVIRPRAFDPKVDVDALMTRAIDRLNDEMTQAGVRTFVGGLQPPSSTKLIHRSFDGTLETQTGTPADAQAFLDGLWVINVVDIEEALRWGEKAAQACRASIEVRPFYR